MVEKEEEYSLIYLFLFSSILTCIVKSFVLMSMSDEVFHRDTKCH